MAFNILYNDGALLHEMLAGHPERVDRYKSLAEAFDDSFCSDCLSKREVPGVSFDYAIGAHSSSHVELIQNSAPQDGHVFVDSDTVLMSGSLAAIGYSLGAAITAIDLVMSKDSTNSFSMQRPPGHHAESNRAMGFCFFNNAACAAFHARRKYGVENIAVIDFDVHHGNGTQEIFWRQKNMLYLSTHQQNHYPGTGSKEDCGEHNNICNAPLPRYCDSTLFRQACNELILPKLDNFRPDIIIISAGFDAHRDDPLGDFLLTEADFSWITLKICDIADRWSGKRVISLLEGGYNLDALASSAKAHVRALAQLG